MTNYILKYYQQIKDGSATVGKWVEIVFSLVVHGIETKKYTFDAKKADDCIRFIENYCHHMEGRSDKLTLELWQKAVLSCMFGVLDDKGNRQFREVLLVIGRKNGKTLLASAVMAYMAFADGEWGGKIYCIAPKLDQADIVYSAFQSTIHKEPKLEKRCLDRVVGISIPKTETRIKKIPFSSRKTDGLNPSLCVCDEASSWVGDAGKKQYEVLKSALGARRQPMIFTITTSGFVNDGIYDELIKRSTRFLLGESKESRLLPFLYMIDDISKWNDINELRKSNPNLGVSVSVDYMLEEIAVAEGSLSKKSEFLCKYCNIKQNSSQAFLSTADVGKASGEALSLDDFRESYCVGGIDLSRTTDLSSACIVIEKGGELYVFSKFWLPTEKIDEAIARDGLPYREYITRGLLEPSGENVIDYEDCRRWFNELVSEYHIYPLQIGYDRYNAQYLTQAMQRDGFHMDDVFQGWNLTPIIHTLEGSIKDGLIHIGDNDLLKIHLLNTALKIETESEKCKIIKMSATDHIDGAAALLDALTVRDKWYGEIGGMLKNEIESE